MSDEREDLDNLVTHPGWLRFREQVRLEWGAKAYAEKVDAAAAHDELVNLKALRLAKDAVMTLIGWPEYRLKRIAEAYAMETAPESLSRRGPL